MKRYEKCILATCPVPWDEDYKFAEDIFRDQLRIILKHGTNLFGLDVGFLISVACTNWKRARIFYEACLEGDADEIKRCVMELKAIHAALVACVGTQGHIDGAFDKHFSKIADHRFPLRLLPPYGYADDESFEKFSGYIKDNHPRWMD